MTRTYCSALRSISRGREGVKTLPSLLDKIETVPIGSLEIHPENPRRGDIEKIAESLAVNGQYDPLVVQRSRRRVLAGNHRLIAARDRLGWTEIDVVFVDVDDEHAGRILLADNRTSDVATYDTALLVEQLRAVESLEGTGYDDDALKELQAALDKMAVSGASSGDHVDRVPDLPEVPVSKAGEVYELGEHRLFCGDTFATESISTLVGGASIAALITDPPYGIALDTDFSGIKGSAKARAAGIRASGRTYPKIVGDDVPFDAAPLAARFSSVPEQFWFGANYYRRTLSPVDLDGSWLVWDKRDEGSDAVIGSGFELIWSKRRHKQDLLRFRWSGFSARNSDSARSHVAEKPVALLAELLRRYTEHGDVVIDPFAGSGSTLIACEWLGRRGLLAEIDPAYCDVIRRRYEEFAAAKDNLAWSSALA